MHRSFLLPFRWSLIALPLMALAIPARAANWATDIRAYSPGATYVPPIFPPPNNAVNQNYISPAASTLNGIPAIVGVGSYPGVLSPFNSSYEAVDLLGVGENGSVELKFAAPVRTNGYTIGIHTGTGLTALSNDSFITVITADDPFIYYTAPRRATVQVSKDENVWVTLGTFDLNNPSNYYATGVTDPFQPSAPGGTPADVEKPFLGTISSFGGGKTFPQVLATLDGSAGGNWLDLSGSGLDSVNYIRFNVPAGSALYLDGVVGLPALAPVPEPAALGLLALGGSCLLLRRRRTL